MISVIGDIIIDEYISGLSYRNSPEYKYAPVISVQSVYRTIGGAGNTALNIKHLGQDVVLYCATNSDGVAMELLIDAEIRTVSSVNYEKDIVKSRIYSNNTYLARVDRDTKVSHDEDFLINQLFQKKQKLIIISDYGKGTVKTPSKIINRANNIGIPVLVDSKSNLSDFKGATILKPNLNEFLEWVNIPQDEDTITNINKLNANVLAQAIESLKVDNLLITIGEHGCIHVTKNGAKRYDTPKVPVVDVTGAGDSFIAGLAVAMAEEQTMDKAIIFANKVASVCVTKKGTQYVKHNEI